MMIFLEKSMDDVFKIYIEQLRDGHEEKIQEQLEPDFLDIQEPDLVFNEQIMLSGRAYLAENELVLHWNIQTEAKVACSICNELVSVPVNIQNFYYSEPIKEIKSGVYNFKNLLRETILLETPSFAECSNGNCPKRKEYNKYLKKPSNHPSNQEGYHPFADFDWKS